MKNPNDEAHWGVPVYLFAIIAALVLLLAGPTLGKIDPVFADAQNDYERLDTFWQTEGRVFYEQRLFEEGLVGKRALKDIPSKDIQRAVVAAQPLLVWIKQLDEAGSVPWGNIDPYLGLVQLSPSRPYDGLSPYLDCEEEYGCLPKAQVRILATSSRMLAYLQESRGLTVDMTDAQTRAFQAKAAVEAGSPMRHLYMTWRGWGVIGTLYWTFTLMLLLFSAKMVSFRPWTQRPRTLGQWICALSVAPVIPFVYLIFRRHEPVRPS